MFSRILVGVSADADWLTMASTVAPLAQALSMSVDLTAVTSETPNQRELTAGEVLVDWYRRRKVEAHMLWEQGEPAAVLARQAEALPETLLVVGATAEQRDDRHTLGGVTLELLRTASAHTLVVPPGGRSPRRDGVWRLLYATDFSEIARAGVEVVDSLAFGLEAELHLVHIVRNRHDDGVWMDESRSMTEPPGRGSARLDEAMVRLTAIQPPMCVSVERHVTGSRDVPSALIGDSDRLDCDLLVIPAQRQGLVGRLLLGSVSESVVRQAARPVLIVRPGPAVLAAAGLAMGAQDTVVDG